MFLTRDHRRVRHAKLVEPRRRDHRHEIELPFLPSERLHLRRDEPLHHDMGVHSAGRQHARGREVRVENAPGRLDGRASTPEVVAAFYRGARVRGAAWKSAVGPPRGGAQCRRWSIRHPSATGRSLVAPRGQTTC